MSLEMPLEVISIPPKNGSAKNLLVICHGWGANAEDVAFLASLLNLPDYHLIFPNAPFPHEYNPVGRAWYNFPQEYNFLSNADFYDQPELQESREQLRSLLLSLEGETGVPLDRTVLSGFSQGGAMTIDVGLHLPVAALMVLSGYMHAPNRFPNGVPPSFPPVFMVHGRQDIVVPLPMAQQTRDSLRQFGATVEYEELNMGHEIQPIVLKMMQSFLQKTLR